MKFENFNFGQEDAQGREELIKGVELSPSMQELYDEIVSYDENESEEEVEVVLEEKIKRIDRVERFEILGKAVKRLGKMAKRIAFCSLVGSAPLLAQEAEAVKENLLNETQQAWQDAESKKLSPREERLKREKEAKEEKERLAKERAEEEEMVWQGASDKNGEEAVVVEEKVDDLGDDFLDKETQKRYWAAIGQPYDEGDRGFPTRKNLRTSAFENGEFNNPEEYNKWEANLKIERTKVYMEKYPEAVEEIKNNIDKIKNFDKEQRIVYADQLAEKYNIDEASNPSSRYQERNPRIIAYSLLDGVLENK